MVSEQWNKIGKNSKSSSFSDQELIEQITTLSKVISYLVGRGDSQIIVRGLVSEEFALNNMAMYRNLTIPNVD